MCPHCQMGLRSRLKVCYVLVQRLYFLVEELLQLILQVLMQIKSR